LIIKMLKDTVLGNLTFSRFEGLIFSNLLFNRLHHVTQNSMVFRVFPSNKTTRFSHSTGVMHMSSMIFKNGLANAEKDTMEKYLEEKCEFVEKELRDTIKNLKDYLSDQISNEIKTVSSFNNNTGTEQIDYEEVYKNIEKFCGYGFVKQVTFHSEVFKSYKYMITYLLLLSSVRLCGLLHDIGHLCFGHLSEQVLEDLERNLENKGDNLKDNERDILETLQNIPKDDKKIHEVIGDKLNAIIFEQLEEDIEQSKQDDKEKGFNILFCRVLQSVLKEVKKGHQGQLNCLYSIVSSDFDADRLDFVVRDGLSSGLIDNTGDIERILLMFCLGRDNGQYRFMPAIQALNDVQEVLIDRYRIYRYLVNHHKVKKLDYLLHQSLLISMIKEIAENDEKFKDEVEINQLKDVVGVIGKILEYDGNKKANTKKICYQFSQINDNWALTNLNRRYSGILSRFPSADVDKTDQLLKNSMTEIFTGAKVFESLWKRDHEYHDFLEKIKGYLVNSDKTKKIGDIIEGNKKDYKTNDLFLHRDNDLSLNIIRFINEMIPAWQTMVEEKFSEEGITVLIVKPRLDIGIKDLKLINLKKQDVTYTFKEISEAYNYLNSDMANAVQFYVYYISSEPAERIIELLIKFMVEIVENNSKIQIKNHSDDNN